MGQEGGGALTGSVADTSQAAIPSARVSITNRGTGLPRSVQTDNFGNYRFSALPIGVYDVVVSHEGFSTLHSTGVEVSVGSITQLDLQLKVAQVSQDVTVQAEAAVLNTESAEGGVLMNATQVTDLPLNGRNFLQLVTLEPGVRVDTVAGRQAFTMNGGAPGQGLNLLVDGTDATGIETAEVGGIQTAPGQSVFTIGLDSISEFNVHADTYSARYGKSLGGVIEVVTKSGTNGLHGDAFYFFRNDVLNANTIQGNAAGLPRAPLRFNQFGANSGGPIVRDRMFFWAGYEAARRRTGVTDTFTVLSDAGRAAITDPSIASFVQKWVPRANQPPTSNPFVALLVRNDVQPVQEDIGTARWDYRISDSDNFFVRYNIYESYGYTPGITPNTNNVITNHQQLGTLSLTHVFNPTTTMDLRTGVNRLPTSQTNPNAPDPGISLNGIFSVSGSYQFNAATAYTYAGDITRVIGRHTLSAGFEYHTTRVNRGQRGNNIYNFVAGPSQFNNFFQNVPDQLASASVIGGNSGGSGSVSAYFEDSFRQSRKLTLIAGLRYDYFLRPTERFGRIVGLNGSTFPLSNSQLANLQIKKPGQEVINPDYLGFGPRLGVAYTPNSRTVIRGGAGIFVGLNYPALTTAAAFTFIPPVIPVDLYNPYYSQTAITFTRQQRPDLIYPNVSFLTPQALLQNAPPPSPNFPIEDWRNTESAQYNFRIERELMADTKLSVGYVGSKSWNIVGEGIFNTIEPLLGNARPNPAYSNITLRSSINDAHYNSLQVAFNRRLSRGLQVNAYYTYSKSIDNVFGFSSINDPGVTPQNNDFNLQRSPSTFDVPHELKVDYYYELPIDSWTALPKAVRQGWTINGITRINSGTPYTITTGGNTGDGVHTQRPNLTCQNASTGSAAGLFVRVLNPACFAVPNVPDPQTGLLIGNLGRNTFYGPSSVNFDFSIFKNTHLSERVTHQLRVEFFDIFNKANFQAPITTLNNPNFGRILAANSGRQIQLAMKVIW